MAGLSLKKKGTVIHRTTSETLRIGEEIFPNQIRISQGNRKKSQATSPSCSFQITGILTRYDTGEESADELDESHTDEISRVTDNETPSFSEDSRDDFQPYAQAQKNSVSPEPVIPSINEIAPEEDSIKSEESIPIANKNCQNLGRFKVVKVGSVVPFSRGRWTCYDYLDPKSEPTTISRTYCHPTLVYSGSIVMREYLPETNNSTYRPTTTVPVSRVSCHQTTVIVNSNLDDNQNRHMLTNMGPNTHHLDNSKNITVGLPTASCQPTIDTKIEHALDVVKSHLTHTVRLEVEELKIKINELVERISHLEYENDLLRANVTPDVLATLHSNIKRPN